MQAKHDKAVADYLAERDAEFMRRLIDEQRRAFDESKKGASAETSAETSAASADATAKPASKPKSKRGGSRPGAGRKPTGRKNNVALNFKVSEAFKAEFERKAKAAGTTKTRYLQTLVANDER